MNRRSSLRLLIAAIILAPALLAASCRSYHIDISIENRSGAPIQLLEVDYPSASFGADSLAAGTTFHYRIEVIDSGPLKITYTEPNGKQAQITGPDLAEHQQGRLEIVLLPGGHAEFHPQITPAAQ